MGSSHNLEMSSLSTNKANKINRLPPEKKAKKTHERPKEMSKKAKKGQNRLNILKNKAKFVFGSTEEKQNLKTSSHNYLSSSHNYDWCDSTRASLVPRWSRGRPLTRG
jgi:hypothetical protein